jgi:hypothetical protein
MIAFPSSVRVWLAVGRTDMRRGMPDKILSLDYERTPLMLPCPIRRRSSIKQGEKRRRRF